jgi:ankyrin repeat protein
MLHWAVDRNQVDVVALLLKEGAHVNTQDDEGMTPLHYAVSCEYVAPIKLLV